MKPSFLLLTLATAITSVSACERTCGMSGESKTQCSYNCWRACGDVSETSARNNFANAMRKAGHTCTNSGAANVKCKKTKAFGSCNSHYWNCGKKC